MRARQKASQKKSQLIRSSIFPICRRAKPDWTSQSSNRLGSLLLCSFAREQWRTALIQQGVLGGVLPASRVANLLHGDFRRAIAVQQTVDLLKGVGELGVAKAAEQFRAHHHSQQVAIAAGKL